jgi:UDP-arabinose 4-epimerase
MPEAVLVTGGAGYVGSHTCKALARAGFLPVTYDNLSTGHRAAVSWGPIEEGDILDAPRLAEVFERYQPAAVLHFAASIRVAESVAQPQAYYDNNVVGTLRLLEACRSTGVTHFILSSTAAVYGEPQQLPIPEDHPLRPVNPYGATKLLAERLLADFGEDCGLRSCALRYFNAAGADPEGELGAEHEPRSHLVPILLEVAAGLRQRFEVFGEDYPTGDGSCVRDYVHVSDLAQGHVAALDYLRGGGESGVWNLGTGRGWSVRQMLDAARAVTGADIVAISSDRRTGDPPALVADPSSAIAQLRWTPALTEPATMIRHHWDWMNSAVRDSWMT